jgi:hypothetical protein
MNINTGNKKRAWLRKRETALKLKEKFGKQHWRRILAGIDWTSAFWKKEDGTAEEFAKFCEEHFITDEAELDKLRVLAERHITQIFGANFELFRVMHRPLHVNTGGPVTRWDKLFARIDPFTAVGEMLFGSKISFAILLNLPCYPSSNLLLLEDVMTREQWRDCRLTDAIRGRTPARMERKILDAYIDAEDYINDYNIYTQSLLDLNGECPFSEHKKLISHWGLRDEIRAQYFQPGGFARQHLLYEAMKKIVLQRVPHVVIDRPDFYWDPARNIVRDGSNEEISCDYEPNVRYKHLQNIFLAEKAADRYYSRNFIERSFIDCCEIPEKAIESLLRSILECPYAKSVAKVLKRQLGRKLAPFDIWYDKFVRYDEKKLDPIVKKKYPNVASFAADIPNILKKLGFAPAKAKFIASKIKVEVARGSGHAWGALRREDMVLLRTRCPESGMDFQGFAVSMHELGHTVEEAMCLHLVDHEILSGLPNLGFSEAFAFLFEKQKLKILGIDGGEKFEKELMILERFWDAFEIAGVALLDMQIWRWLYKHRDATPEDINVAIRALAKAIWNRYFAPVLGVKGEYLLAIYSHIINYALYMPNYAIGSIVSLQILEYCRRKKWPEEMERMCKIGNLTPNAWMKRAVGSPLSLQPMLRLTKQALKKIK